LLGILLRCPAEVLPPQISKIISMDLGDVLVFDDLRRFVGEM
jgi:hypothetical protein